MEPKKNLSKLNIISQCRGYGLSAWQCPQFLFLIMGLFIIASSVITYLIGVRYLDNPEIAAFAVMAITAVLFIIAYLVTRSFERLAEASRLKSEFIDIVSHQLRSPLTNLRWTVDLLSMGKSGCSQKEKEEYLAIIQENVKRMLELVNDLLVVSRIEQGVFPQRKQEISVGDLFLEMISGVKIYAEALNVKINFQPQDNLPKIIADLSQLKIVIENLLDNALRYSKSGGEVEIKIERKGNKLLFKIKDAGVGISEKDKKFIFQKFFRGENVLKKQTQGSGLGLFVVKSIVEKSRGKIWFDSEEGNGTAFYFNLPIK
jgi:signal transduction histidine kinase